MTLTPINFLIISLFIHSSLSVSFQSLYDKQIKTSYGFQILKHYHNQEFGNHDVKHFNGQSMLFMTPWRQQGLDLSIKYMKKFDYFVPCFYDLKKTRQQTIELVTHTSYSEDYLKRVKQSNPNIKIIPRIFIHGMQGDVFLLATTQQSHMKVFLNFIQQIISNQLYDGIFFSSPFVTPNHKYPFSMKNVLKDIRQIVKGKYNKLLMLGLQARQIIQQVDKVVISNYDYPKGNQGITIPISPINWVKQNYQFYCQVYGKSKLTSKLIMAIPLYGYFVAMYGKYDPIQGPQMIKKLQNQKQAWMTWNQQIEECMIYLNKMEYIYFPCLHFLNSRLRYFESINVGVAAFQIGSGLQIFMQMF